MKKLFLFFIVCIMLSNNIHADETLVVYSARKEPLLNPILMAFTKKTGIKIDLYTDNEGSIFSRLSVENDKTPADVLIAADVGTLWRVANAGFLKPIKSNIIAQNIPPQLRDPNNQWFGFTTRARTIIYNKNDLNPSQLSTYQDLASPKWKNKLCLRTSKAIYNKSLIGILIFELGYKKTKQIVSGWMKNLATNVFANDTSLIEAINNGQCQVGLANSYYLGRFLNKYPESDVDIFWANQKNTGVHVNISGGGIIKYTKKSSLALQLVEFLTMPTAQKLFANLDFEYPANPNIKPAKLVANWGDFKAASSDLNNAGVFQAQAVILMDEAGYQ